MRNIMDLVLDACSDAGVGVVMCARCRKWVPVWHCAMIGEDEYMCHDCSEQALKSESTPLVQRIMIGFRFGKGKNK